VARFERFISNHPKEDRKFVFYDGDEYHQTVEDSACWHCQKLTKFYSISFGAHLCSTECADAKWEEYNEACKET
jgi:hypothetical protein